MAKSKKARKKFSSPQGIMKLPKPAKGQVEYFDKTHPALAVRVTAKGTKSFTYAYRHTGEQRRDTLGRFVENPDPAIQQTLIDQKIWGRKCAISLATARRLAEHISDLVSTGKDPRDERDKAVAANEEEAQSEKAARSAKHSYASCVEDFIQIYAIAKKGNRRWRDQRRNLLNANKEWHGRPVASISLQDVNDVLDALMVAGKCTMANRTYSALNTFFRWLYGRDLIPENPMLRVQRPFDGEKARERVWSDGELKAIWSAADELDYFAGPYLRLLLLLGQRRSEVAGMRWDELDLDAATWKLPKERNKSGRDHTFPLPPPAVRILKGVRRVRGNPFVFPGRGTLDGESGPMTMGTKVRNRIKKASGVEDFTFHDARRTFRTGLDKLQVPPHVKDECLNHARRGVGDRHYSQYDYLDEQREGRCQSNTNQSAKCGIRRLFRPQVDATRPERQSGSA